jgi:hypothetical protein
MESAELEERLTQAINSDHVIRELYALTDDLMGANADLGDVNFDLDSVQTILRFIELHPEEDWGAPGPLARVLEYFFGVGYEDELLASLVRKPTDYTVCLLVRAINGAEQREDYERMVRALQAASRHPEADSVTKELAAESLTQYTLPPSCE